MRRLYCPDCNKAIRTESGMAWHQNRTHGKQMPHEDQQDSEGTFGTPPVDDPEDGTNSEDRLSCLAEAIGTLSDRLDRAIAEVHSIARDMASTSVQEHLRPALTRLERLEIKAKELSAFPQRLEKVRTAGDSTRKHLERVEKITIKWTPSSGQR